jgi:hypothetical protein
MGGFDPDQYLGKPYQVTVELTGTGPEARAWVRFVTPAVAGSSANLGQPPASSGPPPRRGTTNAGKPAPAFYWVETNPDADPIKVDDLRRFFTNGPGIDAAKPFSSARMVATSGRRRPITIPASCSDPQSLAVV